MNGLNTKKNLNHWAALIFSVLMMSLLIYAIVKRDDLAQSITRDPLSLLPHTQQNHNTQDAALIEKADELQNQLVRDKLIFFVTSPTPEQTTAAVKSLTESWSTHDSPLKTSPIAGQESMQELINFYIPHQSQLLTGEQKQKIATLTDSQWVDEVLANMSRPISLGISAAQDPLGNLQNWLTQQIKKSPLQQNGQSEWQVDHQGTVYTVLFYQATQATFSLDTDHSVLTAYEEAKAKVLQQNPNVEIFAAGVPMHAAAAAVQANYEIGWFGSISTLGLIILIACGFRSIRAIVLIALSLFIGLLVAFMTTWAVFGQVHVITLIFGTSLIGVAEDYGLHFIASRQKSPELNTWQVRRHVRMALIWALATSVLAYICLGIAPFPGLRQIAIFSVAGLIGAWLTVILVFPLLTDGLKKTSPLQNQFSAFWLSYVQKPPLLRRYRWLLGVLLLVVLGSGWMRLTLKDDLRMLHNSPQWLINEQSLISQALNESGSQYFIVTGQTEQQLLQNEEQLRVTLDEQIAQKQLTGYRATSEWLPSIKQQTENNQLSQSKLPILEENLGLDPTLFTSPNDITPESLFKQPISNMIKSRWLGQQTDGRWASMVSLHGQITPQGLSMMQNLHTTQPQVIWVDKVNSYSALMSEYRDKIIGLLLLAYAATLALLWVRYGCSALYILLPPAAASLVTLAALGWLSVSVQLFTVLPLLLILGMGVDYGIFLVEHVKEQQQMWMTISLGAISTVLSLGILVFSSTPALHILGLTLGIGMTMTWLISGCMGKVIYQKS